MRSWIAAIPIATAAFAEDGPRYSKKTAIYQPPEVVLKDRKGEERKLSDVLNHGGPVMIQFVFTSCPTICPALSATFASAAKDLGSSVRLVSISIDPEHDTPERLKAYARQFKAGDNWILLTGSRGDIVSVQKAFAVYKQNKMWHDPVTILRAPGSERWTRIDGFPTASELAKECRALAAKPS